MVLNSLAGFVMALVLLLFADASAAEATIAALLVIAILVGFDLLNARRNDSPR